MKRSSEVSRPGESTTLLQTGVRRRVTALYVDRTTQQWVVRDTCGEFWVLPSSQDAWRHRLPFALTQDSTLEPVPGHYISLLGIPS
jgi:hypothetical protein